MCSGGQEAWCSTVCVQEGRRPGVVLYVFRRAGGLVYYCMCSGGKEAWCSTVCVQEGRRPGVVLYVFRRAGGLV